VVQFNDMIVKPADEQGRYLMTPEGLGQRVKRPGYPERYGRELIRQTGDKYKHPAD